jgi:hypothetical protein
MGHSQIYSDHRQQYQRSEPWNTPGCAENCREPGCLKQNGIQHLPEAHHFTV